MNKDASQKIARKNTRGGLAIILVAHKKNAQI